jgi:hypothetical protein
MQLDDSTEVVVATGHMTAPAAGELVILHGTEGKYYGLNAVGLRVWDLIQVPRSANTIGAILASEFEVEEDTARKDASCLLNELISHGLARVATKSDSTPPA